MSDFKLQLGCLTVVMYIFISYIKATSGKNKIKCDKLFDCILALAPWSVFFDGATAWTINHLDTVPYWLNLLLHALFFLTSDALILLLFAYVQSHTDNFTSKAKMVLFSLPGVLSVLLILAFLPQVQFIEGETTNYSMGISVYACYTSLILHFIWTFATIILKRNAFTKKRIFEIILFFSISTVFIGVQIFFPETLVSSIFPTMAVLGIYMNLEDPAYRKLHKYNEEMVTGFSTLVENRDNNTGGHIRRTKDYVKIIIRQMKKSNRYTAVLTNDYMENIIKAAPMHDIGKISTPDNILQKPGRLTPEEFDIIKQHAPVGGQIIKETFTGLDEPEFQKIAFEVARYHHEKWNGHGYPDGLSGESIPLHARIMAIADVFDAVSAKRVYRDAMPLEKCFSIIEEGSGVDFDPDLVKLFFNAKDEIIEYYNEANFREQEAKVQPVA